MRHTELFIPGTMIHVSWKVFEELDKGKPWKERTWNKRPIWSPMIVCESNQTDLEKMKWKKLLINLYDITQMKYENLSYQYVIDRIEEGTIEILQQERSLISFSTDFTKQLTFDCDRGIVSRVAEITSQQKEYNNK